MLAKQAFCGAANIGGAGEIGLGAGFGHFEEQDAGARRERGKEFLVEGGVEILAAIEFQHGNKNTLWVSGEGGGLKGIGETRTKEKLAIELGHWCLFSMSYGRFY